MNRYTFFLNVQASGKTDQEAWEAAMQNLYDSIRYERAKPPPIFKGDEEIACAELLNGPPYPEFGINHDEKLFSTM